MVAASWLAVVAVALFVFFNEWWPDYEKRVAGSNLGIPPTATRELPGSTNSDTEPPLSSTTSPENKTLVTGQIGKKTKAPPAAVGEVGYLTFDVTPRGEVYVDGLKVGISPPLKKLAVTPGKHRVEVKSKIPPYAYVFRVKVEQNQSTFVKAIFEPES